MWEFLKPALDWAGDLVKDIDIDVGDIFDFGEAATDINDLMSGMADAPSASSSSGGFLSDLAGYAPDIAKYVYDAYRQGEVSDQDLALLQPQLDLLEKRKGLFAELTDPTRRTNEINRMVNQSMSQFEPYAQRIIGQSRMAKRRAGTPFEGSSEGMFTKARATNMLGDQYQKFLDDATRRYDAYGDTLLDRLSTQESALRGDPMLLTENQDRARYSVTDDLISGLLDRLTS